MYVRVISFGTNWWMMHPSNTDDPYCFRRRVAYFNAAALKSGRRLHHSAIYPGQIRFNTQSGFDPEFPSRAIGKTFLCSGPNQFAGKVHVLFQRLVTDASPERYLVALNSIEHGTIRFRQPGWMSSGVTPISISMRGPRFEAMLLLRTNDWIESDLGRWYVNTNGSGLSLSCSRDGEFL
jgi:hypothetical protein